MLFILATESYPSSWKIHFLVQCLWKMITDQGNDATDQWKIGPHGLFVCTIGLGYDDTT